MCLQRMWWEGVRALWPPLVGAIKHYNIKWFVGLDSYLCFFSFWQAVLADLSTLKVMPLIQIFLYATTI